jgi:hypothetical protein
VSRRIPDEPDENDVDRCSSNLAAVIAVLIVLIMSLVIVRELQMHSILQKCRLSQRPACETTVDRLRVSHLLGRVLADDPETH